MNKAVEGRQKLVAALEQLNGIVIGKKSEIVLAMTCLLAKGHVLLEDLPGSGKTTLAKAFAATLGLDYRRVQFTADLLPADVIGFSAFHPQSQALTFHQGPVFTQLLLADEINRASPKSQSALLEAMEEKQVTIEHSTHVLPEPFFVIATQNPQEQVGTFALPESQLDRFMMRLSLGYPAAVREVEILRGNPREQRLKNAQALLSEQDILALQAAVAQVHVSQAIAEYVQKLLSYTRHEGRFVHGLSTRAGLALIAAAQAYAFLLQAPAVLPEHVQKVFVPVVWHRLQTSQHANEQHQAALQAILGQVAVPV